MKMEILPQLCVLLNREYIQRRVTIYKKDPDSHSGMTSLYAESLIGNQHPLGISIS